MEKVIRVSVRNIVEFALKSGSIDSGFGARNIMAEGTKGHRVVQKLRENEGIEYRAEVPIDYTIKDGEISLEVSGRIDGLFVRDDISVIEEIKTTERELLELDEDYNPMHWAQARCYAYMYGILNGLSTVAVQLTYYHRKNKEIKSFYKSFEIEALWDFFNAILNKYLKWANMINNWNNERDESIKVIGFPFESYRKGQREFAVAAYKTICGGKKLFAKAPTGIGKTIGTIFPAVKALGEGEVSRVFYLTAKTSTRYLAEEAFIKLRGKGLKFRTVTISAKEKVCPQDKVSCKPEDCPFAEGYYDRIDDAMEDILKEESFTKAVIHEYSNRHRVCPFEFSLDLALFCDGIICDYNYVFDPTVYLKRFFMDVKEDYVFLIDEAHNLVDRAREMFSSELLKSSFQSLKNEVGKENKELKRSLNEINSYFIELRKKIDEESGQNILFKDPPKDLVEKLENCADISEEILSKGINYSFREKLLELYFELLNFIRTSEVYDEKYLTYAEKSGNDVKLKLFCLDPSLLLREGMNRGKSSILFSATLTPIDYFRSILGGDEEDFRITIDSPFDSSKMCLMIENNVSTKYNMRELSYGKVADYINAAASARKGNYIVFFPSYKYLNEVYNIFSENYPDVKTICQNSSMSEEEREEFLLKFSNESEDALIGFAVMGGAFGEGIDLTGDRLIGAIIIGVGLPQICLERDIIRDYFNNLNNSGFEYAYVYPGMNKVLQAAGRVIRTEKDRGIVFLIDERFSSPTYKNLMPNEWDNINWVRGTQNISRVLKEFWNK